MSYVLGLIVCYLHLMKCICKINANDPFLSLDLIVSTHLCNKILSSDNRNFFRKIRTLQVFHATQHYVTLFQSHLTLTCGLEADIVKTGGFSSICSGVGVKLSLTEENSFLILIEVILQLLLLQRRFQLNIATKNVLRVLYS